METKFTRKVQGKQMRIQSYQHKRGLFDYIQIIDGNSNRMFMVPHDEFFAIVGDRVEFHWSASYNETDKVRVEHTEMLLKHEYEWK